MPTVTRFTVTSSTSPQTLTLLNALLESGAIAPLGDAPPPPDRPGPSVEYQTLINSIPVAREGDVISERFHNSLRDAIAVIGRQLDETAFQRIVTVPFLPRFERVGDENPWRQSIGAALGPDVSQGHPGNANGWMVLDIPQGTRLESLTLRGKRTGTAAGMAWIALMTRIEIANQEVRNLGAATTLHQLNEGRFTRKIDVSISGLTAAEAENARRVDNGRYQYVFQSRIQGVSAAVDAALYSLEVTCSRW